MTTASPPSQPIPTEAAAYLRADEHIGEAIVALSTSVRLEKGIRNAVPFDAGELASDEFCNVEVAYTLEDLPDDEAPMVRNERYFDRLKAFWAERGYVLISDTADREDAEPPWYRAVYVEHPADHCRVSVKQGRLGTLWITASMTARTDPAERAED